jgi:two-component system, NarL family, sensor histidine kinase DesK
VAYAFEVIRLRRVLLVGRWVMVLLAALFLLALPERLQTSAGLPVWLEAVLLIAPAVVYVWFWLGVIGSGRVLWTGVAVGTYVLLTLTAFLGIRHPAAAAGGFLVFAAMMIGGGFPWRQALWMLAGLVILQSLVDVQQHPPRLVETVLADAVNTAFVGLAAIGGRLLVTAYLELSAAREEIARLAVAEERLRFARDVHDLLGQSLTTVVLRSELAARHLPPDASPELKEELQEVTQAARRSLDEVREAVAGYRQANLDREVTEALMALRAAGITAHFDNQAGHLSNEEEAAFSWALREAVTNVIRHSQARTCQVRMTRSSGKLVLEVSDDGRGAARPVRLGNGLRGIRERARAAGGESLAEATSDGFRTVVELPAS